MANGAFLFSIDVPSPGLHIQPAARIQEWPVFGVTNYQFDSEPPVALANQSATKDICGATLEGYCLRTGRSLDGPKWLDFWSRGGAKVLNEAHRPGAKAQARSAGVVGRFLWWPAQLQFLHFKSNNDASPAGQHTLEWTQATPSEACQHQFGQLHQAAAPERNLQEAAAATESVCLSSTDKVRSITSGGIRGESAD